MPFQLPVRTITAPDSNAVSSPPVVCTGCNTLTIGASSDTPGAQLTYRVILTDSLAHQQGTWGPFTLICGQAPDWGGLYLGMDSGGNQPTLPIVGDFAYIKVDSISPATAKWTLAAAAR